MREETALMLINERISSVKQKKSNALVINLIAGPCAGKSKTGLLLAAKLKELGLRAEYVSEVAKDYVYKGDNVALDGSMRSQTKMLIEQSKRLDIPYFSNMVDIIVMDSPLILNSLYNKDATDDYIKINDKLSKCYNNIFFFIKRDDKFENSGRKQKNIDECILIDNNLEELLKKLRIRYEYCFSDDIDVIVKKSLRKAKTKQLKSVQRKKTA